MIENKIKRTIEGEIYKQFNGIYGEKIIENDVENLTKRILCNLYIPMGNGYFTEVDILGLSNNYIFVIESKNYSGWIFGSEKDKYWTQTINQNSRNKFYNPIMQNNTHINALSNFLKIDKSKFISIIVFSDKCELKKFPENNDKRIIINRKNLIEKFHNIDNTVNFSDTVIDYFYEKLKPLTQYSNEQKQEHIERIRKAYKL
jgi:hypothetical protein